MEKELNIMEIHSAILTTLKNFISICDEINVNYFVSYGSLIGVLRHEGFIPWDDDFDIVMLRDDYDKLCRYCDEHEKDIYPFKLMNHKNTTDYPYCISRFNDLRYRLEMQNDTPSSGMGIFLDIYPFDSYDGSKSTGDKINREKKLYQTLLSLAISKKMLPQRNKFIKFIPRAIVMLFAKIIGRKYFMGRLENIKSKYHNEGDKYVYCLVWGDEVLPIEKRLYENYELKSFEDIMVKIPLESDKILKQRYGDYMKLPPKKLRVAHHNYKVYRKEN